MKLRFYFDYSDYRSYLMMHSLRVLKSLPVRIQWIALDAYSLRAMTACELPCPRKRDFMKQEALRFCQREHLDFIWQDEPFHNGSALRTGSLLLSEHSSCFEPYSRQVLELLWARGQNVDSSTIKNILLTLNIDFDDLAEHASEHDLFQFQDACLQEAIADGVFDIPAVVIGDSLVCHFDQAQEILRLALVECLRAASPDLLLDTLASLMLEKPHDDMMKLLDFLTNQQKTSQNPAPILENPSGIIQHSLPIPDTTWLIPKVSPHTQLRIHRSNSEQNDLFSELQELRENTIHICTAKTLDLPDNPVIPDHLPPSALFVASVRHKKSSALFCLSTDSLGMPRIALDLNAESDLFMAQLSDWSIAVLSDSASIDPNVARHASLRGAHCIVRSNPPSNIPYSEAFAYLANTWVIETSENQAAIIDPTTRRMPLTTDLTLSSDFDLPSSKSWLPPAPRTLLLFEKSLTFGELSDNADIELSCRGMNLIVTTSQQSSELSSTRAFDKVRIHGDTFLLMPLYSEQILTTELVSHRLIQVLNQAPHDALPIFISYWSELEFERLETIRPALALTASRFQIPIIIVVASQVAEIWLSTPQGTPWRIEKEGAVYAIDTAELLRAGQCFQQILTGLQIPESTFLNRLSQIDAASRQNRPPSFL